MSQEKKIAKRVQESQDARLYAGIKRQGDDIVIEKTISALRAGGKAADAALCKAAYKARNDFFASKSLECANSFIRGIQGCRPIEAYLKAFIQAFPVYCGLYDSEKKDKKTGASLGYITLSESENPIGYDKNIPGFYFKNNRKDIDFKELSLRIPDRPFSCVKRLPPKASKKPAILDLSKYDAEHIAAALAERQDYDAIFEKVQAIITGLHAMDKAESEKTEKLIQAVDNLAEAM